MVMLYKEKIFTGTFSVALVAIVIAVGLAPLFVFIWYIYNLYIVLFFMCYIPRIVWGAEVQLAQIKKYESTISLTFASAITYVKHSILIYYWTYINLD